MFEFRLCSNSACFHASRVAAMTPAAQNFSIIMHERVAGVIPSAGRVWHHLLRACNKVFIGKQNTISHLRASTLLRRIFLSMHRRPPLRGPERTRLRFAPACVAAAALLLVLTAATARAQQSTCQFSVPAVGATFDLSPLRLPASSMGYTVGAGFASKNYSYAFNVCDSLGREPAPACVEDPPARTIGPAYQLSSDRQQCFRLGASAVAPNAQWSLLGARWAFMRPIVAHSFTVLILFMIVLAPTVNSNHRVSGVRSRQRPRRRRQHYLFERRQVRHGRAGVRAATDAATALRRGRDLGVAAQRRARAGNVDVPLLARCGHGVCVPARFVLGRHIAMFLSIRVRGRGVTAGLVRH